MKIKIGDRVKIKESTWKWWENSKGNIDSIMNVSRDQIYKVYDIESNESVSLEPCKSDREFGTDGRSFDTINRCLAFYVWLVNGDPDQTFDIVGNEPSVQVKSGCSHLNVHPVFIGPMIGNINYCSDCKQEIK